MDNGGFYNRRSPSVHFGGTSNYYSGIPDQAEAVNRVPSHTSGYAEIDLKLERLIKLVENQHKETESIKLNVEKFREEFDTLKSSVSAATAQSTLVSKRVPSKLSVSKFVRVYIMISAIHSLLFQTVCCILCIAQNLVGDGFGGSLPICQKVVRSSLIY